MKIKRFDNLWLMGLVLSAIILIGIYFMKFCYPTFVIEVAQIDSITRIGHYIDTHKWAWYLASGIIGFANYYFICCASCKKKTLDKKELLVIIITILVLFIIKEFAPMQYMSANISTMILLPCIMKADFKATTIVFVSTNFLQTITGEIRNIKAMITDFNFATSLILTIDLYILLSLLYCYFNYKKER